ncbi:hypothetical protein M2451_001443 [Dysgonomonas sp. PFB1-18]|nr:hypothetical protein [Dysgonomonas sp. PF1-14]MDH6338427.1 hypothetical protein [Dysgonomonas sp. PF1-16]MDH6380126.1 hypothetical protein [Dysgonomonas sp. PFB1-18]MDH6397255.1 hypothetical protein [Dysgonomonas sp. PF1-23]
MTSMSNAHSRACFYFLTPFASSIVDSLPKSKQKSSASLLSDLSTAYRLKGTNGLSPHPLLRHLHRTGARLRS